MAADSMEQTGARLKAAATNPCSRSKENASGLAPKSAGARPELQHYEHSNNAQRVRGVGTGIFGLGAEARAGLRRGSGSRMLN